jgi:ABC-type multidrug transport system fused ATPase/permease subunit
MKRQNNSFEIKERWESSVLRRCLYLLSDRDRRKLKVVVLVQLLSSFLDLLGVALIGALGALTVIGLGGGAPGDRITYFLKLLRLQDQSFQSQALILGVLAALVLVLRTVLSVVLTRKTLFFLSRRGADISEKLMLKLFNQEYLDLSKNSAQDTLYAVTTGINIMMMGVLATSITMLVDFTLLLVISAGLLFIDPVISVLTFSIFALVGFLIYRLLGVRAKNLGKTNTDLSIKSSSLILEGINSYRENLVGGKRFFLVTQINKLRSAIVDTYAEIQFMPYIGKFIIEGAVVIGGLLLCGTQFLLTDAKHAVATMAVFLMAGTRIAPAVLRIQQGAVQIKMNIGAAAPTLALLDNLAENPGLSPQIDYLNQTPDTFVADIELKDVYLTYPGSSRPSLRNVELEIKHGEFIALVGSSGAGKTSLADVILGVIQPSQGSVSISGLEPREAINRWPGSIGYVPQETSIIAGTLRQNITYGFPEASISDSQVWNALKTAQLDDLVSQLPQGLDTEILEAGKSLSGGQRQRLGIARALFSSPKLLVLDEATSSLDGQTEFDISNAILSLRGDMTIITIAHRLATVRNADLVVYLDKGQILAIGDFETVRKKIPNFDNQAKLMGL